MRTLLVAMLLAGCVGGRPHGDDDQGDGDADADSDTEFCREQFAAASDALGCPWPAAQTTDDLCGDACLRYGEAWCGDDAHTVGCPPECASLLDSSCDWRDQ